MPKTRVTKAELEREIKLAYEAIQKMDDEIHYLKMELLKARAPYANKVVKAAMDTRALKGELRRAKMRIAQFEAKTRAEDRG